MASKLSLPIGLDQEQLPLGMQVIAPFDQDERLLQQATALSA